MKIYELWDFESGNRLGEYPDQVSALAYIKEDIAQGKAHLRRASALLALDEHGEEELVAKGEALIALAGRGGPVGRVQIVTVRSASV